MTFNFAMQAIDQIVNSAGKTYYMSGGNVPCPVVFRGPNGAAAGSRSPTSPVLNARDIANSILAETTRRSGVQNIGIGSRTGKPDAAGDLADSAVMHLVSNTCD